MKLSTKGFAVIVDGKILANTVSDTERAAKVNWLVTHGNQNVTLWHTDQWIAERFQILAHKTALVVAVNVETVD